MVNAPFSALFPFWTQTAFQKSLRPPAFALTSLSESYLCPRIPWSWFWKSCWHVLKAVARVTLIWLLPDGPPLTLVELYRPWASPRSDWDFHRSPDLQRPWPCCGLRSRVGHHLPKSGPKLCSWEQGLAFELGRCWLWANFQTEKNDFGCGISCFLSTVLKITYSIVLLLG